jgi:di/tricarboxylate transporter
MIPIFKIPDRPRSQEAHRKFRRVTAMIFIIVAIVLALQYTSHALLAARHTTTLWGVLTGIAFMTVLVEWRWSRPLRRS